MDGLVPIGVYGIQHYLSILGSLILIPLVIVPAMGGSHVSDYVWINKLLHKHLKEKKIRM